MITLVVYTVLLLVCGVLAGRLTRDGDDFFLGGRQLGPLVAAVGASASSSSAWTLLGVSGAAYAWGLSALWLFPACVGGFLLNWLLMAPALRDAGRASGAVTVVDLLTVHARDHRRDNRLDNRLDNRDPGADGATRAFKAIAVLVIVVSMSAYIASQFQGAGKTFHAVFDVPVDRAIIVGAVVIMVYMFLGGFIAVSLTDTVQGLVMALTAVALPAAAVVEVGGFGSLYDGLAHIDTEGFLSLGGPRPLPIAIGFIAGLLGIGFGYPGQPHIVKYFLALDSKPDTVRRARRIAIAWAVTVYAGMLLLGLCGRVLFAELGDRETVFLVAAQELFPPVVGGVMLAAVLSAMMSTADSQLLVVAATIVHDLGFGRDASLWRARFVVVATVAIATLAALVGSQDIFSRVLFGWSAMGAAFGPALFVRHALGRTLSGPAVAAAALVGASLAVFGHALYEPVLDTTAYRGVFRHIVPYLAAGSIVWWGSDTPSASRGITSSD